MLKAVATPITSPRSLKSGPPEEPGAIGAEICSTVSVGSTTRIALTRPLETVSSKPSGCPMATTLSPGWTASLSPSTRAPRSASTRTSARSRSLSTASTSTTGYSCRSGVATISSRAPTITWRLVAIHPGFFTTKPVPSPVGLRMETIDGVTRAAIWAGVSVTGAATAATVGAGGGVGAGAAGTTRAGPAPQEIAVSPSATTSSARREARAEERKSMQPSVTGVRTRGETPAPTRRPRSSPPAEPDRRAIPGGRRHAQRYFGAVSNFALVKTRGSCRLCARFGPGLWAADLDILRSFGEVAEWLKAHAC